MPKLVKMLAPSVKNGRRSSKNVSNCVRFTTAGSTSTWPKSGLIAAFSVRLLDTPYLRSRPPDANPRDPSLKGEPSEAGLMNSPRPVTYGITWSVDGGWMPAMPSSRAMRDARPASFLGTSSSQSASLRRWMIRCTLMPHV